MKSSLYKISEEMIKTSFINNNDIKSNKKLITTELQFNLITFQTI